MTAAIQRRPLLILILAYWLIALSIYGIWEERDWYPITGDEPHHIIIGRSLLHFGSLEQTQAYEAEFARGYLGEPGDIPNESNAHVKEGPRGRFSVHSPGTGFLALIPIAVAEAVGYGFDVLFIKTFFVLLSGAAVAAAWFIAKSYLTAPPARVFAVCLTCFSLPLLLAASQVFPDLIAGVICLCVFAWLCQRSNSARVELWQDATAMAAISALPWLHYKFALLALVLAAALTYAVYRSRSSRARLAALAGVAAISGALFFSYNYYAFGDPFATPSEIHYDSRILMWFFTLSIDRWHGFILQNPTFAVGVLFIVPFVIKQPLIGVTASLAYLAVIGINAAHAAPGYSFAGRHAWTGAMLWIPATIYGLACIESLSRRVLYGLGAALAAVQVAIILPLLLTRHDLYNQDSDTWFDVYRSFYPEVLNRYLPAFYDLGWWHLYAVNYVYITVLLALALLGTLTVLHQHRLTLPFIGGTLAFGIPIVVLVSSIAPDPPRDPRIFSAQSLHRHFGTAAKAGGLVATVEADEAGLWTFGPYIDVAPGNYRVLIAYSSDADSRIQVGGWDVTGRAGAIPLGCGNLYGTDGDPSLAVGEVQVDSTRHGKSFEVRLYFDDAADLSFQELTIEVAD